MTLGKNGNGSAGRFTLLTGGLHAVGLPYNHGFFGDWMRDGYGVATTGVGLWRKAGLAGSAGDVPSGAGAAYGACSSPFQHSLFHSHRWDDRVSHDAG